MKLTNLVTGGTFECGTEQGERLLAEGGYVNADAPESVPAEPKPVVKRAPRKAAGGTH